MGPIGPFADGIVEGKAWAALPASLAELLALGPIFKSEKALIDETSACGLVADILDRASREQWPTLLDAMTFADGISPASRRRNGRAGFVYGALNLQTAGPSEG